MMHSLAMLLHLSPDLERLLRPKSSMKSKTINRDQRNTEPVFFAPSCNYTIKARMNTATTADRRA